MKNSKRIALRATVVAYFIIVVSYYIGKLRLEMPSLSSAFG